MPWLPPRTMLAGSEKSHCQGEMPWAHPASRCVASCASQVATVSWDKAHNPATASAAVRINRHMAGGAVSGGVRAGQPFDLGRADEIVGRQATHIVCGPAHHAAVVMHAQVRMVVFVVRDESDCIDEGQGAVIVRKAE